LAIFVDTSGLYAVLDRDDHWHRAAAATWRQLMEGEEPLVTHNYVVVETLALTQRRLGMAAVRAVVEEVIPALEVAFVDERLHELALASLVAAGQRQLSLVDWTSFLFMRREGIEVAFAVDQDFVAQGFKVTPGQSDHNFGG
jgi:predicted nucleic acid-binding protein